jgi:hypothetical protein
MLIRGLLHADMSRNVASYLGVSADGIHIGFPFTINAAARGQLATQARCLLAKHGMVVEADHPRQGPLTKAIVF